MLPTALLSTNNNINTFSNGSKRAGGPHHQLIIAVLMTAIFHLTAADVVEFKNHAATKAFLTFLDSRGGAATFPSASDENFRKIGLVLGTNTFSCFAEVMTCLCMI